MLRYIQLEKVVVLSLIYTPKEGKMFKLILAFYIISGNGAVGVHTQTVAQNYSTVQECEVAGKKATNDLSVPSTSFSSGSAFKEATVRYSCIK